MWIEECRTALRENARPGHPRLAASGTGHGGSPPISNIKNFTPKSIAQVLFVKWSILQGVEHIGKQLGGHKKQDKVTERGELMKYFAERLNPSRVRDGYPALSLPRMGRVLQAIPTKDLYYLKRVCDDAKDFSKKFWWEINPKKHTDEQK